MDSMENVIELVDKINSLREEEFRREETKQIAEYKTLMRTLQCLKDEQNDCNKSISKNLQSLTTHKRFIHKLVHNSEDVPVLPVSHNYHKKMIMLLTEGINLINKLENVYKHFNDNEEENNKDFAILNNITSCVDNVASELYNIKSLIDEIQTLQNNVEELCLVHSDEEMEL